MCEQGFHAHKVEEPVHGLVLFFSRYVRARKSSFERFPLVHFFPRPEIQMEKEV